MNLSPLRRIALRVLLAATLAATACQQQPTQPANMNGQAPSRERVAGTRGGSVTYRLTSPPRTLNSVMASEESSFIVAFTLMGGRLIEFDHDKQKYTPGFAESWQMADDGHSLELTLREGLKFSDGQPLTADDIVFTMRAIYDDRAAVPLFRDALTINNRPIETTKIDERRVRFVFPEQVAVPENYLVNITIMPRHVLEQELNGGTFRDSYNVTSDPQRVVTAGPFMLASVVPGERITLKRNPHYWKKDAAGVQLPYLDTLVVEIVADANAALTQLNQGAIDIIDRLRPSDFAALRSQGGKVNTVDLGPGLSTDHMWFNLNSGEQGGRLFVNPAKRAWFSDVRFRQAVARAVDRDSIAANVLQGLATPLYSLISPGNRAWVATDLPRAEYNLEQARSLLREAGFKQGGPADAPELTDAQGNRIEFTLIVPVENEPRVKMATVIQEDLARLGIKMQVAPIEFNELRRRIFQSYDYEACLLGVALTDVDPSAYSNFLDSSTQDHQWFPKQAKPATDWEARINELTKTLSSERDTARRRDTFREIQQILGEQMPIIPIVARHITSVASLRVGNHRPSTIMPYSMWNAEELFVRQ